MGQTNTEKLLRDCKFTETQTFPRVPGGQKTAITQDQAAKLLTMAEFGVRANADTGEEIDKVWTKMSTTIPDNDGLTALYKWRAWLDAGGGAEALAPFGFQLLPPTSDGNMTKPVDNATDTVLNGGDWEAPSFNG